VYYSIQSLLDLQQFSDPEDDALDLGISSALWSLFGQIWPMSNVLARVMLTEPLEERLILEVGCGLALPSMVISQLGGNITASDYHPLAGTFLVGNTERNSLEAIPFEAGNWNISEFEPSKFDLIIGSDLLYTRQSYEVLASYMDRHLTRQGEVILVDPGRGLHRKFVSAMTHRGFTSARSDLQLYLKDGCLQKGMIIRCSRTKGLSTGHG
jgi:predicted nicotinamide N-methyase